MATAGRAETEADVVAVEARVAGELARFAEPQPRGGLLNPPMPYVRRHAVEHAAAGGVLDGRFISWAFLPYVDPARLRPLQVSVSLDEQGQGWDRVRERLTAWRQVAHSWDWSRPASNADALTFWSACLGAQEAGCGSGRVRVRWAHPQVRGGEILCRGSGSAVATAVLPDGRAVAVTGSRDATVRVWDLATGTPLGPPLTGHTDPVSAVPPDGRAVAVTASWDAVTGSYDGTVLVWDLATGTPLGQPLTGHTDPVGAVATAVLPDGRAVAVTGSLDATVRVWDLTTGTPLGDPLPRWNR